MNEQDRTLDAADDRALDLLVDGELTDEQTRWLLAALDEKSDAGQPNGWRRCALAFVEAQSWNRDLGEIRDTSLAGEADPFAQVTRTPNVAAKRLLPLLLTAAASVLIALAAGIGIGQFWQGEAPVPPLVSPGKSAQPVDHPSGGAIIAKADPSETVSQAALRSNDGRDGEPFQLPVYLASQVSEDYLQDTPPPLSARLQRALARSGHEALVQREWIPVPLDDGNQIVFPVDRIQLRYVGLSHQ